MLIATTALTALAAVPIASAIPRQTMPPVTAHVTPGSGGPRTTFTLSWRNPAQTGTDDLLRRSETVEINGTRGRGCVGAGRLAVQPAAIQQLMRLSLTPRRMSAGGPRSWCAGTFHGSVVQDEHFACAPPHLCPLIEIRPQTITRFSFRVRRRA